MMKTLNKQYAALELVDYLRSLGLECGVSLSASTGSSYVTVDTFDSEYEVNGRYEIRFSNHTRKYNLEDRECLDLDRDDIDYESLESFIATMVSNNN